MTWIALALFLTLVKSASGLFPLCPGVTSCRPDSPGADCRLRNNCVLCECTNLPRQAPTSGGLSGLMNRLDSLLASGPSVPGQAKTGYGTSSNYQGTPPYGPSGYGMQGTAKPDYAQSRTSNIHGNPAADINGNPPYGPSGYGMQGTAKPDYGQSRSSNIHGNPAADINGNPPYGTGFGMSGNPNFAPSSQGNVQGNPPFGPSDYGSNSHGATHGNPSQGSGFGMSGSQGYQPSQQQFGNQGNPQFGSQQYPADPFAAATNTIQCPPIQHITNCQTVLEKDANGCDIAKCRSPMCINSMFCQYPQVTLCSEKDFCTYCVCSLSHCRTKDSCPSTCLYGTVYESGIGGCAICKCAPKPQCPRIDCGEIRECRKGYLRINGCTTTDCKCAEPTCPPLSCQSKECPLGFARDGPGPGCPTCECRRQKTSIACKPLSCLKNATCPPGTVNHKVDGCPVCACEMAPQCPPLHCPYQNCPYGFKEVNSCKTCECLAQPVTTCPYITCPRRSCSRGYKANQFGCPTCDCAMRSRG